MRKGLAILLAPVLAGWLLLAAPADARPLNVVLIMTDNQRLDAMAVMPKTRALIGDVGTTFKNAIVSFPECCPSRATMLTGQYSHNHGVRENRLPLGGYHLLDHTNTLPVWLQAAGYHTIFVGSKYINRWAPSDGVPPGWSLFQAFPPPWRYFGFRLYDHGTLTEPYPSDTHQTDETARLAVAAIRNRPTDRPFFMWISTYAPHQNDAGATRAFLDRPARHVGLFKDARWIPPRAYHHPAETLHRPTPRTAILHETAIGIGERWRQESEALQSVDELVESVVNALKTAGILDRTVVFFTSDHGWFQGENRIPRGAIWPYDAALRVPLMIRGGGFPPGHTAKQLVANVDLAPTMVALTGAAAGRVMDGRSLLPLALDATRGTSRSIVLEAWRNPPPGANDPEGFEPISADEIVRSYVGIRDNGGQYTEFFTITGELYSRELYITEGDPDQMVNRASDPAYAARIDRYKARLERYKLCAGASCSMGSP